MILTRICTLLQQESAPGPVKESTVYLRVKVSEGAVCAFSYSTDGSAFTAIGEAFTAKPGRWADYDWFRVE